MADMEVEVLLVDYARMDQVCTKPSGCNDPAISGQFAY